MQHNANVSSKSLLQMCWGFTCMTWKQAHEDIISTERLRLTLGASKMGSEGQRTQKQRC